MKTALTRTARNVLLAAVLIAGSWIVARASVTVVSAAVGVQPVTQGQTVSDGLNQAGLVVRFDDGRIENRCVAFAEDEIFSDELLERAGLSDVAISSDGRLCRIDGMGCPSDDCWCMCPGGTNCQYWAFYHRENGQWIYSDIGIMGVSVRNGDLQAWSWGQGTTTTGIEPPEIEFDQVCSADGSAAAIPTVTSQLSSSPQVSFVATPPTAGSPSTAVPQHQATIGEPDSSGILTPTPYMFSPPATETPGRRPEPSDGGQPTPTRILLARSGSGGPEQAFPLRPENISTAGTGDRRQLVESRAFSPELLPQYAAYSVTMAVLLMIGRCVLRRQQGSESVMVRQSDHSDEPMTGSGRKE